MASIVVIHGPNLNLLGQREPKHYGQFGLAEIDKMLYESAEKRGHQLLCFQSNAEHELIQRIHQCRDEKVDIIIINPAAFTHTSVALRDAFLAINIPFIEVHLSNIYSREPFRQHSYFSDIALGVVSGFAEQSYLLALNAAIHWIEEH